jgi:hypothetical protein
MLDTEEQQGLYKLATALIAEQLRKLYLSTENVLCKKYWSRNNGRNKKLKIHLTKDHLMEQVREGLLDAQRKTSHAEGVEGEIQKIRLPRVGSPLDKNSNAQVKKISKVMNAVKWKKFSMITRFYDNELEGIEKWYEKYLNNWIFWFEEIKEKNLILIKARTEDNELVQNYMMLDMEEYIYTRINNLLPIKWNQEEIKIRKNFDRMLFILVVRHLRRRSSENFKWTTPTICKCDIKHYVDITKTYQFVYHCLTDEGCFKQYEESTYEWFI